MLAAAGQVRSVRTVAASVSRRHRSPSRCGESPLGGRGRVRTLCAPAIARACSSFPTIALMVERRRRRQWRARCCRLGSLGKLRRSRSSALRLEVGRAHPSLKRAEDVLDRTAPDRHCVGHRVELALYGIANGFMLPSTDASLYPPCNCCGTKRSGATGQQGSDRYRCVSG